MTKIAGTPSTIKEANTLLVKECILKKPKISKPQIARQTRLSLVTVNKIVDELEQMGEIIDLGFQESTGGRKAKQYAINKDYSSIVTVLVRSDSYHLALLDNTGAIIQSSEIKRQSKDRLLELRELIGETIAGSENPVFELGIAVPGTVSGSLIHNIPSIPEWEGMNLKEAVEEAFDLAVTLENDVNASTVGIYGDYASDTIKNLAFLYITEEGIGAGIVINGELYRSTKNFAGELAFMNVGQSDRRGERQDCLESLMKSLIKGDKRQEVLEILSRVLVNMTCVLDPDLYVIDSQYLDPGDVGVFLDHMAPCLGEEYLPEIRIIQIGHDVYFKGLFALCKHNIPKTILSTT